MDSHQEGKTGHFFNDKGMIEVWYKGVCYGNTIPQEAVDAAEFKKDKKEKENKQYEEKRSTRLYV